MYMYELCGFGSHYTHPPPPRQSDSQPNGCNIGQEQQDKNAQPEYNPLLVNHSVKKVVAHLF